MISSEHILLVLGFSVNDNRYTRYLFRSLQLITFISFSYGSIAALYGSDNGWFLMKLCYLNQNLTGLIHYANVFYHVNDIRRLFEKITYLLDSNELKKLNRKINLITIISLIFLIVLVLLTFSLNIYSYSPGLYSYWFFTESNSFNYVQIISIIVVDSLNITLCVGVSFAMSIIYISWLLACSLLIEKLHLLSIKIQNKSINLDAEMLVFIRFLRKQSTELISMGNDVYSVNTFTWLINIFINYTFRVASFAVCNSLDPTASVIEESQMFLFMVPPIFFIIIFADNICERFDKMTNSISDLIISNKNPNIKSELQNFYSDIAFHPRIAFNAWKHINIDRGLLLNFANTAVTFCVMLISVFAQNRPDSFCDTV